MHLFRFKLTPIIASNFDGFAIPLTLLKIYFKSRIKRANVIFQCIYHCQLNEFFQHFF